MKPNRWGNRSPSSIRRGPWPLYGNPNALESALENIVRNALRYSHTKISVSFSVDKDGITVNVDDDGPGVSPEDPRADFPSVLPYR
ncbi:Copper sensory histidine kinase CpxA [Klebsiella oxytoca]|nr:Copper sensory histidine kinase CpxA [Klebsiella oxytoca]